jgi:hypothetical protein
LVAHCTRNKTKIVQNGNWEARLRLDCMNVKRLDPNVFVFEDNSIGEDPVFT